MATVIMLKHPQTGIIRKGLYGFSWTTFFFGGFPALFRGDIVTGVCVMIACVLTFGLAGIVWAFMYNKRYTLGLVERGYIFAGSEGENDLAMQALGISLRQPAEQPIPQNA